MALEDAGLFEKGKYGGIKTSLWIDCLKNTDTAERIEANFGLTHGSFKKGRKEERRNKNTYQLLFKIHPHACTIGLLY